MMLKHDTVVSMPQQGVLLLDAALCEQGFKELYSELKDHQLDPLLFQTPYQALVELGPVIVSNQHSQALWSFWQAHWQEAVWLEHAVWLDTSLSIEALREWLLSRLMIQSENGLDYWMRWGDSRAINRACLAHCYWPKKYWEHIDNIRFLSQGKTAVWQPVSISSKSGRADIFDNTLIHCLAKSSYSV